MQKSSSFFVVVTAAATTLSHTYIYTHNMENIFCEWNTFVGLK